MRDRLMILALVFGSAVVSAQVPTEHCAVAVLTGTMSSVICPSNVAGDASRALDLSGGVGTGTYYVSLCGADQAEYQLGVTVIDGPGVDLQIEEINPNTGETYFVDVSPDAANWTNLVGPYAGGTCAGDVAFDLVGTGVTTVNFVRLRGATATVTGNTPGPDIDAIIAVNYQAPLFGGVPRPYADTLVAYNQGTTISALLVDGTAALGMPNAYRIESFVGPAITTFSAIWGNFVSMGQGAVLDVFFSADWIIDGAGADLIVHEYYSAEGDQFTVEGSDDGTNWAPLTLVGNVSPAYGTGQPVTNNLRAYDLAGSGLAAIDFVRVVSIATGSTGATPGGEVDAIEAVNFQSKPRALSVGTPLVAGGVGTIVLNAPSHVGDVAVIVPTLAPPLAAGTGLPMPQGGELRLDLNDPVLNFVLFDPLGALIVNSPISPVPPSGQVVVQVTLPLDPTLIGLRLNWQSVLFQASPFNPLAASNLCVSIVQ